LKLTKKTTKNGEYIGLYFELNAIKTQQNTFLFLLWLLYFTCS